MSMAVWNCTCLRNKNHIFRTKWGMNHLILPIRSMVCGWCWSSGIVQGVYTFGSPRVGNDVFREDINVKIYRIVNNDDIVPRVPPPGIYAHVGELKFIDSNGIIRNTMIENEPSFNEPRDESYGQGNSGPKRNSFEGFVPAAFRDHVPLLYAILLWNNIIENQK